MTVALTHEELEARKRQFEARTTEFKGLGYDRFLTPAFVLDGIDDLAGPILDLGTGMGLMARELARRGLEVCSVDVNPEDQQVAAFLTDDPALAERITFTPADGASLPFLVGAFGSAVTLDVLHHLVDGAAVLRELNRVVKPGGTIVLAEFSRAGFDLVAQAHAAQGQVHPEGPATLDWARGFLSGLEAEEIDVREGHLHRVAVFRKPPATDASQAFESLDRRGLLRSLDVFAKNWLAHDGCWFLAAEERFGMQRAMELDAASWRRFASAEASRILEAFAIPRGGGLESLGRALAFRMYSFINPARVERSPDGSALRFFMEACRVQETRRKKGLPDFPCKSIGDVEFSTFARTVDPRIETTCLHCPPDADAKGHCGWEFGLADGHRSDGGRQRDP
jgi:SAM-dependent methyltransferase